MLPQLAALCFLQFTLQLRNIVAWKVFVAQILNIRIIIILRAQQKKAERTIVLKVHIETETAFAYRHTEAGDDKVSQRLGALLTQRLVVGSRSFGRGSTAYVYARQGIALPVDSRQDLLFKLLQQRRILRKMVVIDREDHFSSLVEELLIGQIHHVAFLDETDKSAFCQD